MTVALIAGGIYGLGGMPGVYALMIAATLLGDPDFDRVATDAIWPAGIAVWILTPLAIVPGHFLIKRWRPRVSLGGYMGWMLLGLFVWSVVAGVAVYRAALKG